MSATTEQQEALLLQLGWVQWSETMADGRIVKLPFWKDPIGSATSYRNELKQWEYACDQRRYTLQQALRIVRLREQTERYLEEQRAEQAKKQGLGIRGEERGLSAADIASRAAAEAMEQEQPA